MVAGSILPVAWHNGELYFLFGKENPLETSAKGFSDFGGGVEGNETPYQTALREGGEELTGFLGDGNLLEKMIRKRGGVYKMTIGTYHIHIYCAEYDPNLPRYYNENHRFLWDRMDHQLLKKTCLFEKIEIAWMTPVDMRKRIKEFRPFYQDMVRQMLEEMPDIQDFIQKKQNKLDKKRHIVNARTSMNHNRTRRR